VSAFLPANFLNYRDVKLVHHDGILMAGRAANRVAVIPLLIDRLKIAANVRVSDMACQLFGICRA
jgi:hypothetical protein